MSNKNNEIKDEAKSLYFDFLKKVKTEGVFVNLLLGKKFQVIWQMYSNKDFYNQAENKIKEIENSTDRNSLKEELEFAKSYAEGIPVLFFFPDSSRIFLITKRGQRRSNLRNVLVDFFPIFDDDEVLVELMSESEVICSAKGKIKELAFSTKVVYDYPKNSLKMFKLRIKILSTSDNRRRSEESSDIFDTNEYFNKITKVDVIHRILDSKKMDEETLKERLFLFGVNDIYEITQDKSDEFYKSFNSIGHIERFLKLLPLVYDNSMIIKDTNHLEDELNKMRDSLNIV